MDTRYEKIIDLLYHSVVAEEGDGDAIWLIKYPEFSPLEKVAEWLVEYNTTNNTGWEVIIRHDGIAWGTNQEWVGILVNQEDFDKLHEHYSLKIIG